MTAAGDYYLAESGIESSAPQEGFEFMAGPNVYRHTSGDAPVVINGFTYDPFQIERSEARVPNGNDNTPEITIDVPVSHPLAQRYLANGVPPRQILCTVWRQQGPNAEQLWCGYVTSMAVARHKASFLVPSRSIEALKRRLPTITAGKQCPHMLYDTQCRIDRNAFKVATTVALVDGRTLTLASIDGKPDAWARWGQLLHPASGERMTVLDQVGTLVTMQFPIAEISTGSAVELYAGCAHDIITCRDKFANVPNFGGFPQLPNKNPFTVPAGYGVIQS